MGLSNQGYSRATILTLASNPLIHFVWGGATPKYICCGGRMLRFRVLHSHGYAGQI